MKFFEVLDKHAKKDPWSASLMLRVFGTAGLRKFALPVRWVQNCGAVTINAEEKEAAAELGRSQALVASVLPGTLARRLLDEFYSVLQAKVSAGQIKPKSMRLSLRPARSLLEHADAGWQRMPDHRAVEKLLEVTPGQRAALSAFLGFLRSKHGVELSALQGASYRRIKPRDALGKQLAALAKEQPRPADFEHRWLHMALAYFHERSRAQAKSLLKCGALEEMDTGYELVVEGEKYWLPKPPGASTSVQAID
ncbi:hypothetical protein [Acidovorax sp. PRC11]|uniref:hypothetical protein n=1 Tax=Acidovorax sp. PRC11 TaxID=2962592 RepID=UPI002882CC7D|nr:hypothetical protein [Acidovorax sp. PRC11]MDT0139087.1 hypothetical protein [Acidovorax sp. PRC11]